MTSQCTDKVYSDDNDTTDDKTVPDLQDPELPPAKGNSSDQAVVEQESHTADKTITSAYKNVDTESVSCQLTDESKSQENSLTEDPVTEKRSSDDGFQMGISQCNVELNTNEAFAVNSDPEDSPAVVAVSNEKHSLAEDSMDPCVLQENINSSHDPRNGCPNSTTLHPSNAHLSELDDPEQSKVESVVSPQENADEMLQSLTEKLKIDEDVLPSANTDVAKEETIEIVVNSTEPNESFKDPINADNNDDRSILSDGDSIDEAYDEHAASFNESDEDILPGARRPHRGHSDDDDDDEDDEDVSEEYGDDEFVYSDHVQDGDSHYSDAEDPQSKELEEKELQSPPKSCSSQHEENNDVVEVVDSSSTNKESQLDADQDKTNPAYIPRTGRYFMHDYRETEEADEQGKANETKSRTDTRKWQHDRFRYRDQAPRSRAELIRRYGYDIRKDDDKETSANIIERSPVDASDSHAGVERNRRSITDSHQKPDNRSAGEQHEPTSFARGSGRYGSTYRSSQTQQDSHGESRGHPSRSLRGRFTVGHRRSIHQPAPHRGRPEPVHFNQSGGNDMENKTDRQHFPNHHVGRVNHVKSAGLGRSSDNRIVAQKRISARQSQNMRNEEYPTRIHSQQSHPSRRTFTRPRGNPQRDGPPYGSRQPPSVNTQARYTGPSHSGENVAPRSRDDHRPAEQGPKRYSALRQTSGYRPDPTDIITPRQNERPSQRSNQPGPRHYSSKVHSSVICEENPTYSSGHNFTSVTDGFGNPTGLIMDDSSINPTDAQFHPGAVSYSLESGAQPYSYEDGGDPNVYAQTVYSSMAPVDLYPLTGVDGYSESIPVHPYVYGTPVDAYSAMSAGGGAQSYVSSSSPTSRERRPLLGRRPLKPLEIKDPRERGQTTSTGSGQTTDPKGKAPQESWTSTPATEVTSQET